MTRNRSLKQEIADFNVLKFKRTLLYGIKIPLLLMLATIQYGEILISKFPIHLHKPTIPYNQHISSHQTDRSFYSSP